MFKRGKSSKLPAPVVGEVPVQKVETIEVLNLVAAGNKPAGGVGNYPWKPAHTTAAGVDIVDGAAARMTKPVADCRRPDDDINSRAGRFIEDTRKRWYLGLKSFRGATGR